MDKLLISSLVIGTLMGIISIQADLIRECECNQNNICSVREYFRQRVGCQPRKEFSPILEIPAFIVYFPQFNMTAVQRNLRVTKLDEAVVQDFYVNTETNRMVLVLAFTNVTINATTYFGFHDVGKEVENIVSDTFELYPSVVTTTVFTDSSNPELDLSGTQSNINSTLTYSFGQGILGSKDERVIKMFQNFADNVNSAELGSYFTRAPLFASYFIQNAFCDYGLEYTYLNFTALAIN